MAKRLDTEIIINLAGNLTAKARQYGANMSEFAQRNQRAMSVVKATSEAAGRGLDRLGNRYTAAIAGLATGATVKNIADFDAQMRRMGTDAQLTKEQVAELHDSIRDVSNQNDIRIDAPELGAGVGELLGKTGDYEFVKNNLRNMGVMIQAFGVNGQTAAGLMAQFWEKNVRGANDVSKTMDQLYGQFAIGSVSVADIAKVAPKLFSIIQDEGPVAVAQMGALAQVFAKNKGSAEETVTSIQAVYAALSNKKNIEFLGKQGIDVFKPGTKDFKLPVELLGEVLKRAKYDVLKLQDVFDQTSMQGLTALLKPENRALLQDMVYGSVELGETQKAAKTNAEGFNAALKSMNNEWQRLAESNLAEPIQELADALNSVDHETAQRWFDIGKNVAIAGAGLLAARKAYQIGKGTYDFLRPGKKGVPKDVTNVFGSGVMPVYVVNMGAGGLGGGAAGKAKGKGVPLGLGGAAAAETALGSVGYWGLARAAGTGAAMVYLQNEAAQWAAKTLYDTSGVGEWAKGSSFRDWVDTSVDKSQLPEQTPIGSVLQEIKDWMASAPTYQDPSPWASLQPQNPMGNFLAVPPQLQGKIEVSVKDDRVQVTSVKINTPGVTMSAQTGISNVEQD
ncbi:phage tail tape measure protein [Serratia liquefaciens]|uniref:phage tail protein n=1 Tax=Serratia liquefaciens TaxID=614 RepID=UPI00217B4927|nr:phage tail protein [Serratia liquefaciens]CAI1793432.1 Phage-related minor tail protein [Serratia liquefaciens]HEJ7945909.1 phage tail protein [Serratia liquefaciens]